MRSIWFILPLVLLFASVLRAEEPSPVGIDKRVFWQESRVVGAPEPPPPYRVQRAFPALEIVCPMAIAHEPGSDRLWIIHQAYAWGGKGRIVRIKDDPAVDSAETLLDIDGIAYGVAFHPDFARNGHFFVGYNGPYNGKPKYTRVSRYTLERQAPFQVVPGSEKRIIEWRSDGHNGGDLAFGKDGMLYLSSGDGTSDSDTDLAGQDLTRLLAKVLRLDVDHPDPGKEYSVPKDNPFVGQADVRPETWAYGFRNPWRLHADRQTGDIWVGNNGQDLWEQIYLVERGRNYGWSVVEGTHPFYPGRKQGPQPLSKPIAEHPHSEARSMTGGLVYRGKQFPELHGAYLYGDWSTGKIWGIRHEKGKVTWHQELASTTMQITGFGLDSRGELLIADHGGNALFRLERTPVQANPPMFPRRLSETGLFLSVKENKPHPGLIPYSVNAPLWSDGADKERFLALPGFTTGIEFGTNRGWNFSDGAVLVKTFSLPLSAGKGQPAQPRRVETRLLTRQQGQWAGYSYLWNDDQTEAELVPVEGRDRVFEVHDPAAEGGLRKQTWHYPSRVECMVCHSRAANWVLGLTELQMNRAHAYPGGPANQLRTLEHLGIFRVKWQDPLGTASRRARQEWALLQTGLLTPLRDLERQLPQIARPVPGLLEHVRKPLTEPLDTLQREVLRPLEQWEEGLRTNPIHVSRQQLKRPESYRALADPYDRKANLDARARSWLHANCSQCHVSAGGGNAMMELEFTTPREKVNVVDAKPQHTNFGIPDARLIVPGQPDKSVLFLRVSRRGKDQMPPLASNVVDQEAVEMLREWIRTMPADYAKARSK
jgi:glucose/arabinose dehydrogenase